jgi:hypothetical protein
LARRDKQSTDLFDEWPQSDGAGAFARDFAFQGFDAAASLHLKTAKWRTNGNLRLLERRQGLDLRLPFMGSAFREDEIKAMASI